jgi:hypothetical protein
MGRKEGELLWESDPRFAFGQREHWGDWTTAHRFSWNVEILSEQRQYNL